MHIAIDVGGTFTDLVVSYEDGSVVGYKSPSTRPDITDGVFNGLDLIAREKGTDVSELISRVKRIDFGTTIATNAILENKAARTGLIVTKGFRDTLLIREGGKEDSYNISVPYPPPYIPRSLTFEVAERITAEGEVFRQLDETTVLSAIEGLRNAAVEAVAISLIWSIANPVHELRVEQLVREWLPEVAVSVGHQVNPCVREYRRTTAAALDASLKPLVASNVRRMQNRLAEHDFKGTLTYITSSGGKASTQDILGKPVYLCFSGPSAAPESGRRFAAMENISTGNVITVDMGGTSFDVSIMTDGRLPMHREGTIGGHIFGVPSVEVHTIGSGGGSIAHVDSGGFVHVGPASAGSYPGPACYQRGGQRATVTDANLVAGYLNVSFAAGGGMTLSRSMAEQALQRDVAGPLGLNVHEAAGLVILSCEQSMIAAIEELTIKRGVDPRDFVMVAGGAAAGAHAVSIAREIGIKKVIVPKMAGVLSAFGILTGNVSFGFARNLFCSTDLFDQDAIVQILNALTFEAQQFLAGMAIEPDRQILEFTCEARYRGQVWQITLPFAPEEVRLGRGVQHLSERFHKLHAELYNMSDIGGEIEFTEWNAQAIGLLKNIELPKIGQDERSRTHTRSRQVYFKELKAVIDARVFGPSALPVGVTVEGPVVIDEMLTTLIVGPNSTVRLSPFGNYIIEVSYDNHRA